MRIALRGGNFTFDEVLLDEWGSVKMATGVRNCSYGCTTSTDGYGCNMGMDTGVRAGNFFMRCTVHCLCSGVCQLPLSQ